MKRPQPMLWVPAGAVAWKEEWASGGVTVVHGCTEPPQWINPPRRDDYPDPPPSSLLSHVARFGRRRA